MHQPRTFTSAAHAGAPATPFRKIFVPWRLFVGLGLVVLGIIVLVGIFVFSERISLRTLLIGPFLVLLGGALMWASRAQGCVTCKTPLEETSTVFPLELMSHVQQAVAWVAQGNVDGLLQLQGAALASTPRMAAVIVAYCPACRSVAELTSATNVRLPNGASTHEGVSSKVALVGAGVGRVLDMIGQRNTALTHAMYGGPVPQ
jgi:hypothetical protein